MRSAGSVRHPPRRHAPRRVLTALVSVLLAALVMVGAPALSAARAAPVAGGEEVSVGGPGAGIIMGQGALPAASLGAARSDVTDSAQDAVSGRVVLSVTGLAPEVVGTGEDITVSGTITNGTDQPISDVALVVQMQSRTEVTTAGLAAWLGDEQDTPLVTVAQQALAADVAPGMAQSFRVTVRADDLPLEDTDQWGPRGVQVALIQGYTTVTEDRTILLWDPGVRVSPTRVTVFVPVTASPEELLALTAATRGTQEEPPAAPSPSPSATADPSGGAADQAGAPAADSGTPDAADAAPGPTAPPASVPDPEATAASPKATATDSASADAAGTAAAQPRAGQPLTALRERVLGLLGLADDGVVLAVDPALLAALGLDSIPANATASPGATPSAGTASAAAETAPAATDADRLRNALAAALQAGDVVVLPWADADLSGLAHLGETELIESALERAADSAAAQAGAGTDAVWSAGALDATTLASLPDSVTTVVAEPGDAEVAEDLTYTPSGTMTLDGRTVLIPEEGLSAAAGGRLVTGQGDAELSVLDAVQLLRGQAAILTRQAPALSRDIVVAVSRADAAGTAPEVLRERLAALTGSAWTEAQDLPALVASAADSATNGEEAVRMPLPDSASGEGEVTAMTLAAAREAATRLESVASILSDPDRALGMSSDVVALAGSATWRTDEAACTTMISQARAHGEAVTQALAAAPSSTINLIASAADLPVRIVSSLDQDVTVTVHLESSSTRLQIAKDVTVTVPARGQATASVPVTAVGSGDVDLTIQLRSDDGASVGTPSTVHLRVRADWENVGTRILSAALVVLLVAGIVRTVRRGRRTATPRERR
ncbi:DUF6049 family protein [Actinomyces sp. 594]|uniref:DUF6049 family protein n=1 Tax=Actinomyces sp. 594 TaxID=2057793 RepID=UPI00280ACBB7|nr:DUF6049 family protein [Actinomyces sp. 594]